MRLFLHNLYVLAGTMAIIGAGILVIGLSLLLLLFVLIPNPFVSLAAGIIILTVFEAIEVTRRGERL